MSELSDILKEEYIKHTQSLDIGMLLSMIEEAVDEATTTITEEAPNISAASDDEAIEMILKMIPNIEVSEIGWSDVRTPGDGDGAEARARGGGRMMMPAIAVSVPAPARAIPRRFFGI